MCRVVAESNAGVKRDGHVISRAAGNASRYRVSFEQPAARRTERQTPLE
jgi:hypothetical protein